jgi:hypothetical protein
MATQAAADEELAAMREQLTALTRRLDRLEAENRALAATNREMAKSTQQNTMAITEVSEKTDTIAVEVKQQATASSWTDSIRWKGDFRYRFENFDIEGKPNRNRNRIRARASLTADIAPTIRVGLGLASGSEDPLSTNQTLGQAGSSKGLNLDLAYFDWSGIANTHVVGGKFSNFLHKSGKNGLLWDNDWRPEGLGFKWDNGRFFVNGLGNWIESDSKNDQSVAFGTQVGVRLPVGDAVKLTAGAGYYRFDTKGSSSFFGDDDDFFGNSFDPVTKTYLYDYEELELFADLGFDLFEQPALIFADYVQNQAVDENDTAYAFGFKIGTAKNPGQWEFAYVYQKLEADAVLGLLTDADFGGGGTNSKGSIFKGGYAILKNVKANFVYFINKPGINSSNTLDYKRLQLDLAFKY